MPVDDCTTTFKKSMNTRISREWKTEMNERTNRLRMNELDNKSIIMSIWLDVCINERKGEYTNVWMKERKWRRSII
jgi:hypothetical protein